MKAPKPPYLRVQVFEPYRRWHGLRRSTVVIDRVYADDGDCLFVEEISTFTAPPITLPAGLEAPWTIVGLLA